MVWILQKAIEPQKQVTAGVTGQMSVRLKKQVKNTGETIKLLEQKIGNDPNKSRKYNMFFLVYRWTTGLRGVRKSHMFK